VDKKAIMAKNNTLLWLIGGGLAALFLLPKLIGTKDADTEGGGGISAIFPEVKFPDIKFPDINLGGVSEKGLNLADTTKVVRQAVTEALSNIPAGVTAPDVVKIIKENLPVSPIGVTPADMAKAIKDALAGVITGITDSLRITTELTPSSTVPKPKTTGGFDLFKNFGNYITGWQEDNAFGDWIVRAFFTPPQTVQLSERSKALTEGRIAPAGAPAPPYPAIVSKQLAIKEASIGIPEAPTGRYEGDYNDMGISPAKIATLTARLIREGKAVDPAKNIMKPVWEQ